MKCKYKDCPYEALDQQKMCVFHAPVEQKNITAAEFKSQIKNMIAKQDTQFEGFIFPADIEISGYLMRNVNFRNARFKGKLSFKRMEVGGALNFENAKFEDEVDFTQNRFDHMDGPVSFARAVFKKEADFQGLTIPGNVTFEGARFESSVNFKGLTINGSAQDLSFANVEFSGNVNLQAIHIGCYTSFRHAIFRDTTNFWMAKFESHVEFSQTRFVDMRRIPTYADRDVIFSKTTFAEGVLFYKSLFRRRTLLFGGTSFEKEVRFDDASFIACKIVFGGVIFAADDVSFDLAAFWGGELTFQIVSFLCEYVSFYETIFCNRVEFYMLRFADRTSFSIENPRLLGIANRPPSIIFLRTRLNPFLTFFEGAKRGTVHIGENITNRPVILFRQCYLKDVYFTNNDMSMYSLYNNALFEEAHFHSNIWPCRREKLISFVPITFNRLNQILEEELLETALALYPDQAAEEGFRLRYDMEHLKNPREIAALYIRFKAAADRAKDYNLASCFYFNEFEMKRRDYKYRSARKPSGGGNFAGLEPILIFLRRQLYNGYRLFAGYGEMPLWSFLWFWLFTGFFTGIHLFNGLRVPIGNGQTEIIDYTLRLWPPTFAFLADAHFWKDIFYAFLFTISRVIPSAYLPGMKMEISCLGSGPLDISLSLINSFILILMLVFTGVGVKRHFRRF